MKNQNLIVGGLLGGMAGWFAAPLVKQPNNIGAIIGAVVGAVIANQLEKRAGESEFGGRRVTGARGLVNIPTGRGRAPIYGSARFGRTFLEPKPTRVCKCDGTYKWCGSCIGKAEPHGE